MGPWPDADDRGDDVSWISGSCVPEQDDAVLRAVEAFKALHPSVTVHSPDEVPSGKWEVSFPGSSCAAFDSAATMLSCLSYITPDDDTD